jgi:hypothetical protein
LAPDQPSFEQLVPALHDLIRLMEASGVPGVVIGAAAVAILSKPRVTRDVGAMLLLDLDRLPQFLEQAASHGFGLRIHDATDFARHNRVLLLTHRASGVEVDISLGVLPFEAETVARRLLPEVEGLRIPVPSPDDLLIMKAVAGRGKDFKDIELILDAHPNLDLSRVHHWLPQFAEALETPEMVTRFEAFLEQYRSSR